MYFHCCWCVSPLCTNSVQNTTHKQKCKPRHACIHTAHDSVAEPTCSFGSDKRKGESWCFLRDSKGYSRSYSTQASDLSLKHSCTPLSHYRGCGAETMGGTHITTHITYFLPQPVNHKKKRELWPGVDPGDAEYASVKDRLSSHILSELLSSSF